MQRTSRSATRPDCDCSHGFPGEKRTPVRLIGRAFALESRLGSGNLLAVVPGSVVSRAARQLCRSGTDALVMSHEMPQTSRIAGAISHAGRVCLAAASARRHRLRAAPILLPHRDEPRGMTGVAAVAGDRRGGAVRPTGAAPHARSHPAGAAHPAGVRASRRCAPRAVRRLYSLDAALRAALQSRRVLDDRPAVDEPLLGRPPSYPRPARAARSPHAARPLRPDRMQRRAGAGAEPASGHRSRFRRVSPRAAFAP